MEKRAMRVPGFPVLLVLLVLIGALTSVVVNATTLPKDQGGPRAAVAVIVGTLGFLVIISGFVVLNPNEARIIQFFGRYVGSVKKAGFHWTVPFSTKRRLS